MLCCLSTYTHTGYSTRFDITRGPDRADTGRSLYRHHRGGTPVAKCPPGQQELYSWGAEGHLCRRLHVGTVTNILGTFVFWQEGVCTDVLGSGNMTRVPAVLSIVLSETKVVAHLSHSSLNPELSQLIVLKLIWPSSSTFQHHYQFISADSASCLHGRLDTHQRSSRCDQLRVRLKDISDISWAPRKHLKYPTARHSSRNARKSSMTFFFTLS